MSRCFSMMAPSSEILCVQSTREQYFAFSCLCLGVCVCESRRHHEGSKLRNSVRNVDKSKIVLTTYSFYWLCVQALARSPCSKILCTQPKEVWASNKEVCTHKC